MSGGTWNYEEFNIKEIGESKIMKKENPQLAKLLCSLHTVVEATDLHISGDISDKECERIWELFCRKWGKELSGTHLTPIRTDSASKRNSP